jgi:hypothetical protein
MSNNNKVKRTQTSFPDQFKSRNGEGAFRVEGVDVMNGRWRTKAKKKIGWKWPRLGIKR